MEIFSDGFSLLLSSSRSQAGIAISNANWAEAGDNHPGEKKNDNKKIKIKIYKSKHLFGEHILSWGLPQKIVTPEDHD